ncbi:Coiled-coil domain-containing protein [Paragonimus westermani]|uniref:Vacuolar ATPase assembly protein VMA22 n=1 Tax=Paragonimus westermani TaxID=34504 RepID=A0A8T0DBP8_9TREM|nr:Coiled-coil domain-containing protein [Paragonimus westermani]
MPCLPIARFHSNSRYCLRIAHPCKHGSPTCSHNTCQPVDLLKDQRVNSEDDSTSTESIPQFQISDDLLVDGVHTDPSADPIRWFAGVLVPSSLRRAQSSFRRALHLIVNLVNQRTILEASGRKLRSMVEARQKQDAASISGIDPVTLTNGN